ncbi:BglG family transcription antiterminator [Streptococcus hyovaginalis]|uniref:BglG family transcription antiterminator n=1 Tax=Streptococcus hyovaginalis TaxID=149015 RepID=UPI000683F634|nr:PTS sugar transporter subunit IIA [Streptococcus hyovaginalis]
MGLEIFYIYFCKILLQFFVIYTYFKNAYNLIINEIAIEFIGGILVFTERQQKLVQILEVSTDYQKHSDLSKKLGCSLRTLYSDIERLKENGFSIISKHGAGIKLDDELPILEIEDLDAALSARKRRMEIVKRLFIEDDTITLKNLSETYLVSQTSIKSDLEEIVKEFDDGNGPLLKRSKHGTTVIEMPLERRISLLTRVNQYILSNFSPVSDTSENYKNSILKAFYPETVVKVSNNIVYSFFRKNICAIPDAYLDNFSQFFLALISQLYERKHIKNQMYSLDKAKHAFYIGNATSLLHKASLRLKIDYTNEDVQYLSQMLVNYRIEQVPDVNNTVDVKIIMEKISEVMEFDFSKDDELKKQLMVHVPAMLSRLRYAMVVKNPFLEQIKLDYSILFNSIWIAMDSLSDYFGTNFTEDEIAFLTLYFQLSLEKFGSIRKILVICPTGIVTSELLINRIKNLAPSLDEIETASIEEFLELDHSEYDVILSTVAGLGEDRTIHYVTAFTKNEELIQILHQDKDVLSPNSAKEIKNDVSNYLMLGQKFSNKNSLLNKVESFLIDRDLIFDGFIDSISKREKLGSTELPLGVAIPHGKSEFVKESFVIVIQNNRKIKWSSHFVDTVFIIGISKKDIKKTKRVISRIYNLINDEQRLMKLKKEDSELEVMKYLYGRK